MFVAVPEIPASLTLQGEQHCVFDLEISVAIFSSQAWVSTQMSHSESLRASLVTHTSKQYDSQWHISSVGEDRLGTVRHPVGGVPVTLVSWPDVSP